MTNHNVETCKKKKKKTMVATILATQPSQKPQKTYSYACHMCGLNGHKMTDCPKFVKMQKMFHGKSVVIVEVQPVTKTQTVTTNVNVVDVNVNIRSKVIEE
jgi:succinyl-CoA synthetase beta subunit